MQGARWWLVCYDVRESGRLRRTARHMEGYGQRVQYSVFRCWLTPRSMERLRWELTELLTPEDDVLFIPLCSTCVLGMRTTHGDAAGPGWPSEAEGHQIVRTGESWIEGRRALPPSEMLEVSCPWQVTVL